MNQALDQAGLTTADIDYISAHGTGTRENDSIETKAVKAVFAKDGDLSKVPPMSSIKSMMGHLIAAAGAVEAIVCILALRDQMLPPTINLDTPIRSATSITSPTPPVKPRSTSASPTASASAGRTTPWSFGSFPGKR